MKVLFAQDVSDRWVVSTKSGPGRTSQHKNEDSARKAANNLASQFKVPVEIRRESGDWPHNTLSKELVNP
jgi:hypothetical protein